MKSSLGLEVLYGIGYILRQVINSACVVDEGSKREVFACVSCMPYVYCTYSITISQEYHIILIF
jgi:hypothetical protein